LDDDARSNSDDMEIGFVESSRPKVILLYRTLIATDCGQVRVKTFGKVIR